jgi:hypothetical protein
MIEEKEKEVLFEDFFVVNENLFTSSWKLLRSHVNQTKRILL